MDLTREISWNLGLWRGENRKPANVPLAPWIDLDAYYGGHAYGLTLQHR